jgi:hypothetical protein
MEDRVHHGRHSECPPLLLDGGQVAGVAVREPGQRRGSLLVKLEGGAQRLPGTISSKIDRKTYRAAIDIAILTPGLPTADEP